MDGIIIVDKPQEWTSFDVVAKIRNLSREKKVGHSGTLDPMATGVLPVFLGRATKSIQYFMTGEKGYVGEITLGITTDSGDATGTVMSNVKCSRFAGSRNNYQIMEAGQMFPPEADSPSAKNEGIIIETIKTFTGEIKQLPPMYSAVKVAGQRLYKLARKGLTVEREPRLVTIHSIKMLKYEAGEQPRVTIEVVCSKGTYIRQLAVDIGERLGCGAHLSQLVRIYAHPFRISQALSMEAIVNLAKIGKLETVVIPVENLIPAGARR
ncbi:tRNA pseudouridine(55) synthase TruB [Candidatus Saganbacteria bacterium]|nr:tRNA pseudouridine(55) synthase TruB [Candidatus Saganbacteria bacterium]